MVIYVVIESYTNRDSNYEDREIVAAFLQEVNAQIYCDTHKSTRCDGYFFYEDVEIRDNKEVI